MTLKNTQAKSIIERMGHLYGVNYDNKTYKNIEKILKSYKSYTLNKDFFDFSIIGKKPMTDIIPMVYKSFIKTGEINENEVNLMVMQILNDENTEGILLDTLEDIKNFTTHNDPKMGNLYYSILKEFYFSGRDVTNTELYCELDLPSSTYSYRKEEAIMLFGIKFWGKCLPLWGAWEDEIKKLQINEGRDDLVIE